MDKNNINWLVSVLGALAWASPWVYSFFSNPVLKGKLLSHYSNLFSFGDKTYLVHFISMNIISLKKTFQIEEVEVNIKYKDASKYKAGFLFWDDDKEWAINGKSYKLNIKPEDTLPFVSILPQDTTKNICLTFRVESEEIQDVDLIELVLTEYTGRIYRIKINFSELNQELLFWDSRNWKKLH